MLAPILTGCSDGKAPSKVNPTETCGSIEDDAVRQVCLDHMTRLIDLQHIGVGWWVRVGTPFALIGLVTGFLWKDGHYKSAVAVFAGGAIVRYFAYQQFAI